MPSRYVFLRSAPLGTCNSFRFRGLHQADEECIKFLADAKIQEQLNNTHKLADVKESDYAAIFYVGGHVRVPFSASWVESLH